MPRDARTPHDTQQNYCGGGKSPVLPKGGINRPIVEALERKLFLSSRVVCPRPQKFGRCMENEPWWLISVKALNAAKRFRWKEHPDASNGRKQYWHRYGTKRLQGKNVTSGQQVGSLQSLKTSNVFKRYAVHTGCYIFNCLAKQQSQTWVFPRIILKSNKV